MTRLLIDGVDHCEVLEMHVAAPVHGRSRHRLLLDKPVAVDLLERRRFEILLPEGQVMPFDAVFDEDAGDGCSLTGSTLPAGFRGAL